MPQRRALCPQFLADPVLGRAHFDRLDIETDSICDPRQDRVMPIFAEEQIAFCRALARHGILARTSLGRRLRVLDIGTGSGVFAIWAAVRGCDVTAIDINPRALRFGRRNWSINRRSFQDRKGAIRFRAIDIAKFARGRRTTELFDIALMNPPFNPTAPGLRVAQHADAGPDGMRAFRRQLPLAWRLVKEGGVVAGCQLVLHPAGEASRWWEIELTSLLPLQRDGPGFDFVYAPLLKETEYPAWKFLRGQYRTLIRRTGSKDSEADRVREYIRSTLDTFLGPAAFGFYYYELRKIGRQHPARHGRVRRINLRPLTSATWEDRISLHRKIIEARLLR